MYVATLSFRLYSTQDGGLKLMNTSTSHGSDTIGSFEASTYTYSAGGVPVTTTVRGYDGGDIQILAQASRNSILQHSLTIELNSIRSMFDHCVVIVDIFVGIN